jgi:hypothetical protein
MYMPAKISTKLSRILQKCLLLPALYFVAGSFSLAQDLNDSITYHKKAIQDSLIKAGYWESQVKLSAQNNIQISKGRPYYWRSIKVYEDKLPSDLLFVNKLNDQVADQFLLNKRLADYIKINYHRRGYPLAKANLVIERLTDNKIDARVTILPQNYIVYDSLNITGASQVINRSYLANLLNLHYNQPFDINSFASISDKVEQLEYLTLQSPPTLAFANNKAKIDLKLEKESSNQFDALLGVIPDGSRTNLTGQVDARLRNLFKRGIDLNVFWQKYSASSQLLNTRVQQLYAFRSPLGINFGFELLQEDSTFLQTDLQLGTSYPIGNRIQIGVSYQRLLNNVLREFSENEVTTLEPLRSSTVNAVLIGADWKTPITYPQLKDYAYAQVQLGIGNKQITNYSALPDSWQNVPENSSTISGGFKIHLQKVLGKRFLLEAIPQYKAIQNPALSQNDLIRLGGLQNLRGFDRNFFYTRYYGLLNLNYRYFLDQMSSFFLLTDIANLRSRIDWVYTVGAGLDVKSRGGWFRIIYALGQEAGNKPDFSQGKVHFGYIAVF